MSDTPRTDEARLHNLWNLSEELERELNAMTAERDAGNAALANVARLMDSVSKAEAEVERLREALEKIRGFAMTCEFWGEVVVKSVDIVNAVLKETK